MKFLIKAMMFVLLVGPAIAIAESAADVEPELITLSNPADIKSAIELSDSIDGVSRKVMACNSGTTGNVSECDCNDLQTCKFKKEYKTAAGIYCKIKAAHPSWAGKTVNFYIEENKKSHSLYMAGLEQQFGQACKK